MRLFTVLVTVLALVAAGCVTPSGAEDDGGLAQQGGPDGNVSVGDRPDPKFGNVTTGPGAAPDAEATLERAPELQVGEWWRIRFTSPLSGETVEFVRVIADTSEDGYVVGMPHEGWYKEAVVYHAPGFGDVNADLSYLTHNVPFQPVKFPLEDGASWTTQFSGGANIEASVSVQSETEALVTFTNANGGTVLTLLYDATIHEVREFKQFTVEYEVIEHGYDYEGWVTVPRGEDLVFFHGRIGPALDIGLAPAPPMETVEVSGGFNRVTFILAAQSIGGTPGVVRERAVAPDGTEYVYEAIANTGFTVKFFEHADPDGIWELEHVVAGAGAGFIEGIAYHQYDIKLPEGFKRSDHSHPVVR